MSHRYFMAKPFLKFGFSDYLATTFSVISFHTETDLKVLVKIYLKIKSVTCCKYSQVGLCRF